MEFRDFYLGFCDYIKNTIGIYEREKELEALLLGLFTGENVLFIGNPGTAKTMLVREFAKVFDFNFFSYQLNKYTEYQEVFGPFDLNKFKEGILERVSRIQDAEIIYLDEVFRGSSAILNSLLSLFRERVVFDGYRDYKCKMIFTVGSSNFLPDKNYENEAFIDRFPLIRTLKPISVDGVISAFKHTPSLNSFKVSRSDFESLRSKVQDRVNLLKSDDSFEKIYTDSIFYLRTYNVISDRNLLSIPKFIAVLSLILEINDYPYLFYYLIHNFFNYKDFKVFEFLYSEEMKKISGLMSRLAKATLRDKAGATVLVNEIRASLDKLNNPLDLELSKVVVKDLEVFEKDLKGF
ncbi:MAG: AAA family ATPase [Sulfurihydrogenibium azorense]|uniref:AAA family ATPase n=1 Tax=Sulfurihydrogenibium azorense TaxID=309806 RepID=UPI00391BB9EF